MHDAVSLSTDTPRLIGTMRLIDHELKSGWRLKRRSVDNNFSVVDELLQWDKGFLYFGTINIPSEVHVELLKAKLIPNPYVGFNEHKVQWVGEREWLYARELTFDTNEHAHITELVFEGLDTICDVYLNETKILPADNQFRTYSVILDTKRMKQKNKLLLHFKSAKLIAKELEGKHGRVRAGSCNLGDPSRVYVRKAQYDWRWDWGPELMTVGIYRPTRLLTYTVRIANLNPVAHVSADLDCSLAVKASYRGDSSAIATVLVRLRDPENNYMMEHKQAVTLKSAGVDSKEVQLVKWIFDKDEIKLWWPTGYGEQSRYSIEVTLLAEDWSILDQQSKSFGFRSVKLVQEPLVEPDRHGSGTTFLFEINNVRMFMGGSNWIPADNFLTTVTPEIYRAWLQLLKDGNQNMVRVWGGGIYEPDIFYDICDELGILVWQDFQFACGVYPAHDEFVQNVKAEAEDNVTRLRHHPSIVLFCGNNEDYQQVLQWGGIDDLPARKIYEDILPQIVSRLTGDSIPYHRGSPYGGKGWDTSDPTVGDIHQWDVWAGKGLPYHDYDLLGGRFVSEFGVPAMPSIRTIDHWLQGDATQRYAQSPLMAQHNKAGSHERRFAVLMNDNFRQTADLETHVYNTQIMQADALSWAYRAWRREWRGNGKEYTAGALVWQLNDCWPVTSWAIVDYFMRPKPAYFAIARELKPVTVGLLRIVQKSRDTDRPRQFYDFGAFPCVGAEVQVWATNATLSERKAKLELSFVDLESDWVQNEDHAVTLKPNQTTEILTKLIPEPPASYEFNELEPPRTHTHTVVISARLSDVVSGEVLSRSVDWPQPYRFITFPDPSLAISVEGETVKLEAKKPVKGVVLSAAKETGEVQWSDNGLDIMPGDPQSVTAKGLDGERISVVHMGNERGFEV